MANMTFTRGYITILARKRDDVAKFIYLVKSLRLYIFELFQHGRKRKTKKEIKNIQ